MPPKNRHRRDQERQIDVLTETSWFDNDIFKKDIMDYGGAMTNQYTIPWVWDNAGGYSALITVTTLEGNERTFMMDFGWNNEWMDYIYEEKSDVASKAEQGKSSFIVLSHWHLDHLWGIESTLKHKPDIKLYVPEDITQRTWRCLRIKPITRPRTKTPAK
jgi:7,8-dihydropterin-6-yl-methyl-4-(beta-D-ribofuranosyl)aminobenzene 5'-phosphate synthase